MGAGKRLLCAAAAVTAVLMIPLPQKMTVKNIKTVEYVRVEKSTHQLTAVCDGELKCAVRSELYITEPVYVEELSVKAGDYVEAGDVLLTVDRETTKAVAESGGTNQFETALAVSASADLEKYEEYLKKYGVTESETDASDKTVKNTTSAPKNIRSPFTGTVTELNAGKNQLCGGSGPLAVIEDRSSIYALLYIEERYANELQIGAEVELTGEALGENILTAEITGIIPEVQKRISGSSVQNVVCFEAKLLCETGDLMSGSSVEGIVFIGEEFECISLPYECIRQDDEGEYVWVIKEGRAEKRRVSSVRELQHTAQLEGEIAEGERVIFAPDNIEEGTLLAASEYGAKEESKA